MTTRRSSSKATPLPAAGGGRAKKSASPIVHAILAQKLQKGKTYYQVQWEGNAKPTWELETSLADWTDAIRKFQRATTAAAKATARTAPAAAPATTKRKSKRSETPETGGEDAASRASASTPDPDSSTKSSRAASPTTSAAAARTRRKSARPSSPAQSDAATSSSTAAARADTAAEATPKAKGKRASAASTPTAASAAAAAAAAAPMYPVPLPAIAAAAPIMAMPIAALPISASPMAAMRGLKGLTTAGLKGAGAMLLSPSSAAAAAAAASLLSSPSLLTSPGVLITPKGRGRGKKRDAELAALMMTATEEEPGAINLQATPATSATTGADGLDIAKAASGRYVSNYGLGNLGVSFSEQHMQQLDYRQQLIQHQHAQLAHIMQAQLHAQQRQQAQQAQQQLAQMTQQAAAAASAAAAAAAAATSKPTAKPATSLQAPSSLTGSPPPPKDATPSASMAASSAAAAAAASSTHRHSAAVAAPMPHPSTPTTPHVSLQDDTFSASALLAATAASSGGALPSGERKEEKLEQPGESYHIKSGSNTPVTTAAAAATAMIKQQQQQSAMGGGGSSSPQESVQGESKAPTQSTGSPRLHSFPGGGRRQLSAPELSSSAIAAAGKVGAKGSAAPMDLDGEPTHPLPPPVFSLPLLEPGAPVVPAHLVVEFGEGELKEDLYAKYWQEHAMAVAAQAQARPLAPLHNLLPPEQSGHSRNGVSPCKISMVNPDYNPLDQIGGATTAYALHALDLTDEPGSTAAESLRLASSSSSAGAGAGSALLPWAQEEQRAWEWSKRELAEWTEKGDVVMQPSLAEGADEDESDPGEMRPLVATTSKAPGAGESKSTADQPATLPTIHLNGVEYSCVPGLLAPPRIRPSFDEVPDDLPLSPASRSGSRGPSLPPSPFITPPGSLHGSPSTGTAASAAGGPGRLELQKKKSRELGLLGLGRTLSPPSSGAGGRKLPGLSHSTSLSSLPSSSSILPPSGRRSNDTEIALLGVVGGGGAGSGPAQVNVHTPRMTRAEEAALKAAGKMPPPALSASGMEVPAGATPRLSRGASTPGGASNVRLQSPFSAAFDDQLQQANSLTSEEAAEEQRLSRRRGHLGSADNARYKYLQEKKRTAAAGTAAATTGDDGPAAAGGRVGSSPSRELTSTETTPDPDPMTHAPLANPKNRRERRDLARAEGALKPIGGGGAGAALSQLDVVMEDGPSPAGTETPSRRTRGGLASGASPIIPTIAAGVTAAQISTPQRMSRSQLDLSRVAVTPKDWPERYQRKPSPAQAEKNAANDSEDKAPPAAASKRKLQVDEERTPVRMGAGAGSKSKASSTPVASSSRMEVDEESGLESAAAATGEETEDADDLVVLGSPAKKRKVANVTDGNEIASAAASHPAKQPQPIYGNYASYYGYHNAKPWVDDRLALFQASWFAGRTVLDLGCNAGLLTILIASTAGFAPKRVVGIDLDEKLIAQAKEKLAQRATFLGKNAAITSQQQQPAPVSSLSRFATGAAMFSSKARSGSPSTTAAAAASSSSSSSPSSFPSNVHFEVGNLLTATYPSADVVLCMSVTKWVHFHHGDQGVRDLFEKIHRSLTRGGLCILEPQPWKTYAAKANLTPQIKENYRHITFKPEEFPAYLTKTFGWTLKHTFHHEQPTPVPEKEGKATTPEKGFGARPIYVFEKK